MFGWSFYRTIWDVLSSTGLIFLPLLGLLIDLWRDAHAESDDCDRAGKAVRTFEVELYLALFVIVLAGQPTGLTALSHVSLSYTPPATLAEPTPATATGAAPASTFGAAFAGTPATVEVPIWWYAMMALSSGFNRAVIAGFPGVKDVRGIEQQGAVARRIPALLGCGVGYRQIGQPVRGAHLRTLTQQE